LIPRIGRDNPLPAKPSGNPHERFGGSGHRSHTGFEPYQYAISVAKRAKSTAMLPSYRFGPLAASNSRAPSTSVWSTRVHYEGDGPTLAIPRHGRCTPKAD